MDLLLVHLDGQRQGLPLGEVLEVCLPLPTTPLPIGAPPAARGLAVHRDRVVTVVGEGPLLVVLREPLALAVEKVEGVRRVGPTARGSALAPAAVVDTTALLLRFGLVPG